MLTRARCAVLGHPVAHSLSPAMHRAAYDALGLEGWAYEAVDLEEDEVARFVAGLDASWRGLSVTKPLKRAVIAALDDVGDVATEVDAVNTVTFAGGRRRGDNTDVPGAVAAIEERGVRLVPDAVVLGAGATATSLVAALCRLGLRRVTIGVRDERRADALVHRARGWGVHVDVSSLGPELARPGAAVLSTVPAGAVVDLAPSLVAEAAVAFDAVYDPWPTALATAAARAGVPTVSGLDLLAHQAVLQVELMTGRSVSVALLREAATAALR